MSQCRSRLYQMGHSRLEPEPGGQLIQFNHDLLSEAIRGLEAASSPRKALVIVSASGAAEGRSIPGGIQTVRAVKETAEKTVML